MRKRALFPYRIVRSAESAEQQAFFAWIRRWEPAFPELYLVHHVPNGGWRHPATARRMFFEGVRAGIPDVAVPIPRGDYHGLWLEFKAGRKPTEHQRRVADMLTAQGYLVRVVRSAREAANTLANYLEIEELRMP